MSRILVSVISSHGDDQGMILPFSLTPLHVIIIPIYKKENKNKVISECEKINSKIISLGLKSEIDFSEKTPGEKFNIWELKGVPMRIEIGEKELKEKKLTFFLRDIRKKEKISLASLSKLKEFGEQYNQRLFKKADKMFEGKIINCKTNSEIKKIVNENKIARINFCSIENGIKCAEIIEKEISAEIRGTLANKEEKASGNCIICNKPATQIAYVGRSY